jgi:hypothetical protein
MTDQPIRLGCGQCAETFDTPDQFVDHLLVTRHMDIPVDAETDDVRELVTMFTQIQAIANGAPVPEGASMRKISEADIEDDDELTDEHKADLLAWMREPIRLPLSPLPDPETEVLGLRAQGEDGRTCELWLTKGEPRGELRGHQHGELKWRHPIGLHEIALFKAAADEAPGAQALAQQIIETLHARYTKNPEG